MTLDDVGNVQNIIAALIATIAAVIYNIAKYLHDKTEFKSELFFSFNSRYEALSNDLEKLLEWETQESVYQEGPYSSLKEAIEENLLDPLSKPPDVVRAVNKYITLCSEQYYLYKQGFVDENVWLSWKDAMLKWHQYLETFRIIIENETERKVTYFEPDFLSLFKQPPNTNR